MRFSRNFSAFSLASALTGCALFTGVAGPSVSLEESKQAITDSDYPKLKDLCTGAIAIRTNVANDRDDTCEAAIKIAAEKKDTEFLGPLCGRRNEDFGARFAGACPALTKLAAESGDDATLTRLCKTDNYTEACSVAATKSSFGDLAHPDCKTLASNVAAARKDFLNKEKASPELFGHVVAALAKCDEGQEIFEDIAYTGEGGRAAYGTELLVRADGEAGEALLHAFASYVAHHRGKDFLPGEHGRSAAEHVTSWLLAQKHVDLCEPLAAAADGADEDVRVELMPYFLETSCKPARGLAVALLTSKTAEHRALGCTASGKLGDASLVKQLTEIAQTDHANRVAASQDSGVVTQQFYVADACREAAGRLASASHAK